MTMMRWEPFRNMTSLRNAMDRLLEDSVVRPGHLWPELERGEPALDVYQTDSDVVVTAALPGVKPEEVEIAITGETLTIKGEHTEEREVKEENYLHRERRHGVFSRSILIPLQVTADKAEAVFENGVLTLTLPKAEEVKPKQIKVKAKGSAEGGEK